MVHRRRKSGMTFWSDFVRLTECQKTSRPSPTVAFKPCRLGSHPGARYEAGWRQVGGRNS